MNEFDVSKAVMKLMIILYLLHKLLPVVGYYMSMPIYLAVFLLTALMTLYMAFNSKVSHWATISLVLFFPSVFDALYVFFNSTPVDTAKYLYGEAQVYIFIVIALLHTKLLDSRSNKKLLMVIMGAYFLTALSTGIVCTQTPNVARIITGHSESEIYYAYRKQNVGDFVFTYEFILLTPLLACCLKNKTINRMFGIALMIFIGWVVLKMQFTLGIILFATITLTLLLPRLKVNHIVFLVFCITAIFLFARPLLGDMFEYLSGTVENKDIASRFEYIETILRGEEISRALENNAGTRFERYIRSLQAFLNNPLGHWGTGDNGGHSYILDRAAMFGLPGLVAIAVMYFSMYNIFLKPYHNSSCYPYLLLGFLLSIVMATINTMTFMFIFVCVYPLFARVYSENERTAVGSLIISNSRGLIYEKDFHNRRC